MAAQPFVLDDILAELTEEQYHKTAEFWARLDILTDGRLPDFTPETLNKLGNETVKAAGAEMTVDMTVMHKKPAQKVLKDTNPAQLLDALRRNVKHEDPDTLLVRFLRARSWKPDEALIMLLKSLSWRIDTRIEDDLLGPGEAHFNDVAKNGSGPDQVVCKDILHLASTGESFVYGSDKQGRVIQWIRVKLHNPKGQGKEGFEKASILDAESTRMLLRSPQTTIAVVFDLTGFGMGNMDMNALKIMAGGLQDNYPECLGCVYVYNAPWIIGGIWSMIKAWLDPVVASKVQFLNKTEQLAEFIDIDTIPRHMGGNSSYEFKWTEPPPPSPLTSEQSTQKTQLLADRSKLLDEYIDLTKIWAAKIVQKTPATQEMDQRHALVIKLEENYWQLDPLVRGKVYIDKAGILLPGGKVNLRP